jgi:hypothetical protein
MLKRGRGRPKKIFEQEHHETGSSVVLDLSKDSADGCAVPDHPMSFISNGSENKIKVPSLIAFASVRAEGGLSKMIEIVIVNDRVVSTNFSVADLKQLSIGRIQNRLEIMADQVVE